MQSNSIKYASYWNQCERFGIPYSLFYRVYGKYRVSIVIYIQVDYMVIFLFNFLCVSINAD